MQPARSRARSRTDIHQVVSTKVPKLLIWKSREKHRPVRYGEEEEGLQFSRSKDLSIVIMVILLGKLKQDEKRGGKERLPF